MAACPLTLPTLLYHVAVLNMNYTCVIAAFVMLLGELNWEFNCKYHFKGPKRSDSDVDYNYYTRRFSTLLPSDASYSSTNLAELDQIRREIAEKLGSQPTSRAGSRTGSEHGSRTGSDYRGRGRASSLQEESKRIPVRGRRRDSRESVGSGSDSDGDNYI
jgi:hypothetical protein